MASSTSFHVFLEENFIAAITAITSYVSWLATKVDL
jgi:hypothetical protein